MKKYWRGLVTAMIIGTTLSVGACNIKPDSSLNESDSLQESVQSDSLDGNVDSTLQEPETLETVCYNVAEKVLSSNQQQRTFRQIGRTFISESNDKVLRCDFTCTGIAFNAICKGEVRVKFWTSNDCYFTVYIDGERVKERLFVSADSNKEFITVASFAEYGQREIRLVKQSQYPFAYCGIADVEITGSFGKRPAQKDRFIEYYGDSGMNGSNILLGGTSVTSTDGTLAFAYMSALELNADCSLIGRGGMGLYPKDSATEGMNQIWNLTSSSKAPGVQEYDFGRVPDVVVVALGGNDTSSKWYTEERFTQSIQEMIGNIRSAYGNDIRIVWCYNYSLSKMDYWDIEKAALDEVNDGTILYCPITCIPISKEDGGDGRHTDAAGGKTQGSELAAFIEQNIYA